MSRMSLPDALRLARERLFAGKLADAESICNSILAAHSREHGALRLLGLIENARGDYAKAEASIRLAISIAPGIAEYHDNLSSVLLAARRFTEAEASALRAMELGASHAGLVSNLGYAVEGQGRLDEASDLYQQALAKDPEHVQAAINLGNVLLAKGQPEAAVVLYRRVLATRPSDSDAWFNLGNAYAKLDQLDGAADAFQHALAANAKLTDAWINLGGVRKRQGRLDDAIDSFRRAIALDDSSASAHFDLGIALMARGRVCEAEASYWRAIQIRTAFPDALNNLGNALQAQGRVDEAAEAIEAALAIDSGHRDAQSSLLFNEQYRPGVTPQRLFEAHQKWGRGVAVRVMANEQFANDPDPDRLLRIGFLSPNYRRHPVAYFFVGCLEHFDRASCRVFCYSDAEREDEMTARIKTLADEWRSTRALSDDELAATIRGDAIDILVAQAGHTLGNRLLVLARKPAPIQMSWTGYVGTTGLGAIDYVLGDRFHVPEGSERNYVESVIRLPDGYVCYSPPDYAPEVCAPPCLAAGAATFGSFNNIAKLNAGVVASWAEILHAVPGSRLLLKYRGFEDVMLRQRFESAFFDGGIAPERLMLEGASDHRELLESYSRVDVALDPFPYSGGITTIEALWMGVPVVTLPGTTFAGRHSFSHLSNAGLAEFIAADREHYVRLAASLACDRERWRDLRQQLRGRVARSPLCDCGRFAENFLHAMRQAWIKWRPWQQNS